MDLSKAFDKMKELQSKFKETQDRLATLTLTGESGGGMVKVTINGLKQIIKIDIEDEIYESGKQVLSDLITGAANQALTKMEDTSKEEMRKNTQDLLPNIPGFKF